MSEFKGTKGKWHLRENLCTITSDENNLIARVFDAKGNALLSQVEQDEEIVHANAQLIAHATEMLEMLKLFTDFPNEDFKIEDKDLFYTFSIRIEDMIKAKQLIQKATTI